MDDIIYVNQEDPDDIPITSIPVSIPKIIMQTWSTTDLPDKWKPIQPPIVIF